MAGVNAIITFGIGPSSTIALLTTGGYTLGDTWTKTTDDTSTWTKTTDDTTTWEPE